MWNYHQSGVSKKHEGSVRKEMSVNMKSLQVGEEEESAEIELAARSIIKHYNNMKNKKSTLKNEEKLHKIYTNLVCIINRLFVQFFDLQVARQLGHILNKLVYFYESQKLMEAEHKQNMTTAVVSVVSQPLTTRLNSKHQFKIERKLKQYANRDMQQSELKSRINTHRPQIKGSNQASQLRVFMYQKMKQEYKKVGIQREQLNKQIMGVNERIHAAYAEIEDKIRKYEINKIIENNSTRAAIKFNSSSKNQSKDKGDGKGNDTDKGDGSNGNSNEQSKINNS